MTHYRHTQIGWLIIVFMGAGAAIFAAILAHSGMSIIALGGLIVMAAMLAIFSTLTIEVTDEEFRFHFTFGLFGREIPLPAIAKCVEVENSVLYGWGIRVTPVGKLYNVSGAKAVELRMRGGDRLCVGSDEPARVCAVLEPLLTRYASLPVVEPS
ncbi:MAG TPA: hypothetical protein VG323_14210 [Thermoanaerobaculia bacterium]|nr:hypothetical protein [Thermoanaerobaculia bacterium]